MSESLMQSAVTAKDWSVLPLNPLKRLSFMDKLHLQPVPLAVSLVVPKVSRNF